MPALEEAKAAAATFAAPESILRRRLEERAEREAAAVRKDLRRRVWAAIVLAVLVAAVSAMAALRRGIATELTLALAGLVSAGLALWLIWPPWQPAIAQIGGHQASEGTVRYWRSSRRLVALVALLAAAAGGVGVWSALTRWDLPTQLVPDGPPPALGPADARAALKDLPKPVPVTEKYESKAFGDWKEVSGNTGCNWRAVVLIRDGALVRPDKPCPIVMGRWHSLYDDQPQRAAALLDVDHVVPQENAWISGAYKWRKDRLKSFRNDTSGPELIAVSDAENRSKGSQAPDRWKPSSKRAWCWYARAWVTVKLRWKLAATDAEKEALSSMLDDYC
jgi:hypothetical protein